MLLYCKKILNKLRSIYRLRNIQKAHSLHRNLHPKEYEKIDSLVKSYRDFGGLEHEFQAYKLFALTVVLQQKRPITILELGSGTSTAVFAEYVRGYSRKLTSVDESRRWLTNTRRLAGIGDKEQNIVLVHAPRSFDLNVNPPEFKYDISLEDHYDFVFIDGPSMTVDGKKYKDGVNTNIFDICKNYLPKFIVVDIRKSTVKAIIERMGSKYNYQVSDILIGNIKENYNYFSVFTKQVKDISDD